MPPPALVVESTPPSGVTTTGATGIVANVAKGTAVMGVSSSGTGVKGVTDGTSPGGAGVVAIGSGRGFGLWAISNGTAPAVYAQGGATAPIFAEGSTNGAALELFNGGFTVSGTIRPAFLHTAAAGNITGIRTVISHPLLNGRSNAIVTASHVFDSLVGFVPGGIGVLYDAAAGRWSIFREDSLAMPVGARFNVIVFNQ